jgi:N-acetylglucosaminyl-diphospho-decaprenol L-rhamnosyltransferase
MIDGSGRFLKESKRGFPSPWAAFCKLSGLTALFPRSKWLATYYLGHLDENRNHPVDSLSGACMLVGRKLFLEIGGFDEQFFMYGEDIDLSWRIRQAGYGNHYIADIVIVHFKGESTTKDLRYVKLFYRAMGLFMRKHRLSGPSVLFGVLMETAVRLRWGMAVLARLFERKKGETESGKKKRLVTGDPEQADEVSTLLRSAGGIVVQDPMTADEVVFCEGREYPFARSIDSIRRRTPAGRYKIHARGSGSAVGSHSKDGPGEVIIL